MFRYRCPNCRQVLQALEIRAGKTTICSKCSQSIAIPADRTLWIDEAAAPPPPAAARPAADGPAHAPLPHPATARAEARTAAALCRPPPARRRGAARRTRRRADGAAPALAAFGEDDPGGAGARGEADSRR